MRDGLGAESVSIACPVDALSGWMQPIMIVRMFFRETKSIGIYFINTLDFRYIYTQKYNTSWLLNFDLEALRGRHELRVLIFPGSFRANASSGILRLCNRDDRLGPLSCGGWSGSKPSTDFREEGLRRQ